MQKLNIVKYVKSIRKADIDKNTQNSMRSVVCRKYARKHKIVTYVKNVHKDDIVENIKKTT